MPIRFHCVYCDQLLGIAHRKAGTVVKCPNCAGQLIVPAPDRSDDPSDSDSPTAAAEDLAPNRQALPEKTATAPAPDGGMLFERNDFDELLKPALEKKAPAIAVKPPRAVRAPAEAKQSRPAPQAFDFHAPSAPALKPIAVPRPAAAAIPATPRRSGILLTPIKLILLTFFVMGGMGSAFVGGFLLAWYLK